LSGDTDKPPQGTATMIRSSGKERSVRTKCPKCGLRAEVFPTEQKIIDDPSKCVNHLGLACPHLREALSKACQLL
jgi:hypothetical protein